MEQFFQIHVFFCVKKNEVLKRFDSVNPGVNEKKSKNVLFLDMKKE